MQQKAKKSEQNLRQSLGRDPNQQEIAEDLGITDSEMMDWEHAFQANVHQSLDGVYDEFSIWFVSGENNPEEQLNETEMQNLLKDLLDYSRIGQEKHEPEIFELKQIIRIALENIKEQLTKINDYKFLSKLEEVLLNAMAFRKLNSEFSNCFNLK